MLSNKTKNVYFIFALFSFMNICLLVDSSSSRKCATIYNSFNYQGRPLSLADGSKHPSLRSMNFVPNSAQLSPNCVLTLFDSYGSQEIIQGDKSNLGYHAYRTLDAACCECDGCQGASRDLGNLCARLYENQRCDSCSGYRLDLRPGDAAKNFGLISNRMTSVAVRPGCTLTVFTEPEYDGYRFNFTIPNNMLGDNWFKQISSARCSCDDPLNYPPNSQTTVPTTKWPPMTLPTDSSKPVTVTYFTTRRYPSYQTVPTTRAPVSPSTATTTWPMVTLPTVPTTRYTITLPTVPTTEATEPPMTKPTIPTTTEASEEYPYDYYGGHGSEELKVTTTAPTTPSTTENSKVWDFASVEQEYITEDKEDDTKEDEDWDW